MSDDRREPFYKNFFPNISFVTSILVSISTGAAITLPSQRSFFGRDDAEMLAQVRQSASFFAWGVCVNGGSLILSLLMQLLYTSPHFNELVTYNENKRTIRWIVGFVGWVSLLLAGSGMALVAEGLKVVQRQAGLALQWLLFCFCFPVLLFWVVLRVDQTLEKRRPKHRDSEGQGKRASSPPIVLPEPQISQVVEVPRS